ncbi:MAG TPA: STAS domain-containing protein [Gemmataceae bacterium]|nr:STAS domain-containing protein [Gemmataceae bacterium]
MKLNVVARDDQSIHLACEGDLVLPMAVRTDPLAGVLPPGPYPAAVLLDLSKVGYINSTGISWLVQAHQRVQQDGGRLVLHSVQPFVRGVLDLMRLGSVLNLAADEPAARALPGAGV